ncbi:sperm acrosome-associated protein 9 isoform X2 [Microcaecilia unicolor]|uniref:Sperm acrosome-associated protein 9 isoform X2 n=1 Tax=Microcaecilia unicolor TaxID=1415580 RepID=A0A6P7YBB3_9AMPH|nr:sperm acrosome-associated protein 9 isoform X2 [Microcaecilia unicolor]
MPTRTPGACMFHLASTPAQVQHYLENNCYNLTDKRILNMFLDTCSDLNRFCTRMEAKHPETSKAGGPISKCKTLLNPTTDLTSVRAKYPHDVVNRLSCEEAKNYYGGIVSIIPVAMDFIKEGAGQIQKPRHQLLVKTMKVKMPGAKQNGARGFKLPTHSVGVQTLISMKTTAPNSLNKKHMKVNSMSMTGLMNPPWKHAGPFNKWM